MAEEKKEPNNHTRRTIVFIALAFIAVLFYAGLHRSKPIARPDGNADIIYYYGQWDTHSANVEVFLKKNKIEDRIALTKKEVWTNKDNNDDMNTKALQCGLKSEQVGVPFIYSMQKCYVGDVAVIKLLKQEAGIK
jgi:hypothetical protein